MIEQYVSCFDRGVRYDLYSHSVNYAMRVRYARYDLYV